MNYPNISVVLVATGFLAAAQPTSTSPSPLGTQEEGSHLLLFWGGRNFAWLEVR
jgi:hypothetical protein